MKYDYIKKLLTPYSTTELTKTRYGRNLDGGYVLAKELIDKTDIIYSLGIAPDIESISFDLDMASLGKTVYMYDGSIEKPAIRHDKFIFKKEYIYLSNFLDKIIENKHLDKKNMTAQIDIEGSEYDIFEKCDERVFDCFAQLCIEIHDLNVEQLDHIPPVIDFKNDLDRKIRMLERLNQRYFVYHLHGNNNSYSIDNLPNMLEVTYIRKDMVNNLTIETNAYPLQNLDFRDSIGHPELLMNWWL